jgi:erythromycin esterase-like protein
MCAPIVVRLLLLLAVSCAGLAAGCGASAPPTAARSGEVQVQAQAQAQAPRGELDRLVGDLCDKQVVLLGEASHGDGQTFATKSALIERLIDECKFSAVFFESGLYDFLDLSRAGGTVTPARLGGAIGAMWSSAKELEPLIASLARRAAAGQLALGGLDDQISSTALYAQRELPVVLALYLEGEARPRCQAELARYTAWEFDEATPYSPVIRDRLLACLTDIGVAISRRGSAPGAAEHVAMVAALARLLERSFTEDAGAAFDARDRSMFLSFQWLASRLPPRSKIIVWCATIHAAKDLSGLPRIGARVPLGAHVHRAYGDRAAAIGFSAHAGGYARIRKPPTELPIAPADSLEGQVFAQPGEDLRYVDREQLARLGTITARPVEYAFTAASWSQVLDGLVVFRRERPPQFATP